jgi:iron complex transport system permease protein
MISRRSILFSLLIVGLILLILTNLLIGDARIPFADVWKILWGEQAENPVWSYIVENRLYRSITAILGGGGLAISGLVLQVFFRNPLAGPGVLGVTSGAALGVGIVILGGFGITSTFGTWTHILAGLIGAGSVLLLLVFIARYVRSAVTLLVIGLMLVYLMSAVIDVLYLWANETNTREFVVWGLGSFEGLSGSDLMYMSLFTLLSIIGTIFLIKPLNALILGAEYASSVGINLKKVRLLMILLTGIISSVITVFCGPISFIGIAVPQIVRRMTVSSNHAMLLPLVFLTGGFLGIAADLTVRLSGNALPLNTVTALIGAPIIIWVIIKLNRQYA